jgi:hypothetical protein
MNECRLKKDTKMVSCRYVKRSSENTRDKRRRRRRRRRKLTSELLRKQQDNEATNIKGVWHIGKR